MGWRIFDRGADGYEAWCATRKGQRAGRSERKLLSRLLESIPDATSVLEVGCGTGHFTSWFADLGMVAIGLDRAPAMIAALRRRHPSLPTMIGDACELPIRDGAVDVTAFVTALEFLEEPEVALAEAMRVSRRGLILVVLNSWSLGGLSRRWGAQARGHLLGKARDYALPRLIELVRSAASHRMGRLSWTSGLYPLAPAECLGPVPCGDVIGLAVSLGPPCADAR